MPTAFNRGKSMNGPAVPKAAPPEGVAFQAPDAGAMTGKYADEVDEFLHTTDRPDEAPTTGATGRRPPPPPNVQRWLPKLVAASREPGAPQELHEFLRLVRDMMGAR